MKKSIKIRIKGVPSFSSVLGAQQRKGGKRAWLSAQVLVGCFLQMPANGLAAVLPSFLPESLET